MEMPACCIRNARFPVQKVTRVRVSNTVVPNMEDFTPHRVIFQFDFLGVTIRERGVPLHEGSRFRALPLVKKNTEYLVLEFLVFSNDK